jgi:hypothetical protein
VNDRGSQRGWAKIVAAVSSSLAKGFAGEGAPGSENVDGGYQQSASGRVNRCPNNPPPLSACNAPAPFSARVITRWDPAIHSPARPPDLRDSASRLVFDSNNPQNW